MEIQLAADIVLSDRRSLFGRIPIAPDFQQEQE